MLPRERRETSTPARSLRHIGLLTTSGGAPNGSSQRRAKRRRGPTHRTRDEDGQAREKHENIMPA
jgi:hypothetical protein